MPPCGVARSVAVAEVEAAVLVTVLVTNSVAVAAMIMIGNQTAVREAARPGARDPFLFYAGWRSCYTGPSQCDGIGRQLMRV